MRKINSLSLAVLPMLAAAVLFSSCEKDNLIQPNRNGITLSVSTVSNLKTKADFTPEVQTVDLSTPELKLFMTSTMYESTNDPFSAVATKGQIVTTDKFQSLRTSFDVQALVNGAPFAGTASPVAKADGNCPNGDYWTVKDESGKVMEWSGSDSKIQLWAYSSPSAYTADKASVTYKSTATTADATSDLLVGYGEGTHTHNGINDSNEEDIAVKFYHALAAVRFIVGELDGYSVKQIAVKNLKKEGSFVFNPAKTDVQDKFAWTVTGEAGSYTQAYTSNKESNFVGTESESTFFVLPQAFEEGSVEFEFTFAPANGGADVVLTTGKIGVAKFMAGYTYTYNIGSSSQSVGISLMETVDAEAVTTKSDVYVSNVKTAPVFVRVAIVANWYYSNGKVAAPFQAPDFAEGNAKWTKATDGYYYYSGKLYCGENTTNLIEEFKKSDYTAPKSGLHLEMKIMAQAIECGEGTSAEAAFGALNN